LLTLVVTLIKVPSSTISQESSKIPCTTLALVSSADRPKLEVESVTDSYAQHLFANGTVCVGVHVRVPDKSSWQHTTVTRGPEGPQPHVTVTVSVAVAVPVSVAVAAAVAVPVSVAVAAAVAVPVSVAAAVAVQSQSQSQPQSQSLGLQEEALLEKLRRTLRDPPGLSLFRHAGGASGGQKGAGGQNRGFSCFTVET